MELGGREVESRGVGEEVEHLPGRLPRRVGQAAAASWELQAGGRAPVALQALLLPHNEGEGGPVRGLLVVARRSGLDRWPPQLYLLRASSALA